MGLEQMQGQDTEYKPWGLTAGAMVGSRQADMEQANLQALENSQLGNVIKGVEAGRATSDFNNPEMEQWRQQGIMGKQQSDYSKGQLDYRNLDSKVQADFAKNMASKSTDDITNTLNTLKSFAATADSDPMFGVQKAMSSFSPEWQKRIQEMEAKQPGSSKLFAKSHIDLLEGYLANNATTRGTIKVNAAQEEAKMPGKALVAATATYGDDLKYKASMAQVGATRANTASQEEFKAEQQRQGMLNQLHKQQQEVQAEVVGYVKELAEVSSLQYQGLKDSNGKPLTQDAKNARMNADKAILREKLSDARKKKNAIEQQQTALYNSSRVTPEAAAPEAVEKPDPLGLRKP